MAAEDGETRSEHDQDSCYAKDALEDMTPEEQIAQGNPYPRARSKTSAGTAREPAADQGGGQQIPQQPSPQATPQGSNQKLFSRLKRRFSIKLGPK